MKKYILIAAALFGFFQIASAQTKISNESLKKDGSRMSVSFDVDTDVKGLPARRKEILMPYIYNGTDTVWLETLEVYGKGRYKREKQVNHIAGDKKWELGDNQILKGDGIYNYIDQVPYELWMDVASLSVKRQIVGCACASNPEDENLLSNQDPMPEKPVRAIPEGYALADAMRQWDFGQDELEIIFKVSRIEIDSTVFNNEATFGKILNAVDKIFANPLYKVSKIEIAGYASPEGTPEFNTWLGRGRATALRDYIIRERPQYNLKPSDFNLRNGEENWEGLRRMVIASNIPDDDKTEIVNIIDSDKGVARKAMLKALNGGKTYRKMLEEVYPHLRCARYLAVYYDSSNDKAVESINGANKLIREGKYAEACDMVMPFKDDLRSANTIGVALMMQGKFEESVKYFNKALELDSKEALENISTIEAKLKAEAQAQADYEAALAAWNKKYKK